MKVIKKDGTLEEYNEQKIINAIDKSAQRENFTFSQDEYGMICNRVLNEVDEEDFENDEVPVGFIHNIDILLLETNQEVFFLQYYE